MVVAVNWNWVSEVPGLAVSMGCFAAGLGLLACGGGLWGGRGRWYFAEFGEVAFFAAADESFGSAFEFFPSGADFFGFFGGYAVIGGGGGDDGEEVGEFLDDLVGCGDEEVGVGPVRGGVFDEETAGAFTDPLDEAFVLGGVDESFDSVERVGGAATVSVVGFGPFIDHGE